MILTGIDEFVRRDDLADRCVFLELPAIRPEDRRAEVDFWQGFREDQPAIMGGLLDAIVGGLRALPSVTGSIGSITRASCRGPRRVLSVRLFLRRT